MHPIFEHVPIRICKAASPSELWNLQRLSSRPQFRGETWLSLWPWPGIRCVVRLAQLITSRWLLGCQVWKCWFPKVAMFLFNYHKQQGAQVASVSLSADSMGFLAPKTEVAEVAGNIFGLKRLRLSIDRCTCHWQSLPLVDEDVFFIDHHEIPAIGGFIPEWYVQSMCVCVYT